MPWAGSERECESAQDHGWKNQRACLEQAEAGSWTHPEADRLECGDRARNRVGDVLGVGIAKEIKRCAKGSPESTGFAAAPTKEVVGSGHPLTKYLL